MERPKKGDKVTMPTGKHGIVIDDFDYVEGESDPLNDILRVEIEIEFGDRMLVDISSSDVELGWK